MFIGTVEVSNHPQFWGDRFKKSQHGCSKQKNMVHTEEKSSTNKLALTLITTVSQAFNDHFRVLAFGQKPLVIVEEVLGKQFDSIGWIKNKTGVVNAVNFELL